ncbi:MAG: hypothetical protein IJN91_01345 [Alphaproteobacteria bacterium]|nr:hypothetical protein [Alphaproteobacteria bacterium]
MGLKLYNGKKNQRSLSLETGYLYYLYLRMKNLEEELLRVLNYMKEAKPWYDSDDTNTTSPVLGDDD